VIVYLLLNTINLKGYVGQHRGDKISTRWPRTLKNGGANLHLAAARDKYGSEAFSREILNYCSSEEEMNNLERLWIATLGTYDPDFGYNMTYGGEGVHGYRHSVERKKKISDWNKEHCPTRNTFWITNGSQFTRISRGFLPPDGWWKKHPLKGKTSEEIHGIEKSEVLQKKNPFRMENRKIKVSPRRGRRCSPEHIEKNRLAHVGKPSGREGWLCKWITDGTASKLISRSAEIPQGWVQGRTVLRKVA
jgi:group I intron endonuclease